MASTTQLDPFVELICSKICHDLINPLGAINNGMEFLAEGGADSLKDAVSLIESSSRQATARLGLYRLAFGAWGGAESGNSFGTVRKTIKEYFEYGKLTLAWNDPVPGEFDPCDKTPGKLLVNLLLLAVDCAPRGGRITIDFTPKKVAVDVSGDRCALRDDIRSGLAPELTAGGLTVRNVVAHHCIRLVEALSLDLQVVEAAQNSIQFIAAAD